MKRAILLSTVAAAGLFVVGCATGGSGGGMTDGATTMFSSPAHYSADEFSKEPKKYAKSWVSYKGGGVDSFKKVTIPTYTLEVRKTIQDVNRSKLGVVLKGDGTKNELTMNVNLPVDKHEKLMQEIANTSYNRLREKFKKAGVEVIDWPTFKTAHKEAQEFEQEKLTIEPIKQTDVVVSYTASGLPRSKGGLSAAYALSSLSRGTETSIVMPNFGIGFGYFGGETTPMTLKEGHGMAEVQFTPQIQILTGSGFMYQSKWDTGAMSLDKTMINNTAFVKKMTKDHDSRQSANESGEKLRGVYMAATGAQSHETQVSTNAAVNYELVLDEEKFKTVTLQELDRAEDLLIERYKNEF